MSTRLKFIWEDPKSYKKRRLNVIPDFVRIIENVIQTEEQAESFMTAYTECCNSPEHAEHSVGYIIGLIKDKDVRDDAFDLFLVDPQVTPVQLFKLEYRFGRIRNG